MSAREVAAASARRRVVLAVSFQVHGRSLVDDGHDVDAIAAMLDEAFDGHQQDWLQDLLELAGYRAGVEVDPVVYGDEDLPLMTEPEIAEMIDDLVARHLSDPDAPTPAHPSSFRM